MVHASPSAFDAFYADARERLLLQTFALTGDLPAARAAVVDAFVVAWHHWPKVDGSGDPEGSVRPWSWRHAQRRHTARWWHRDRRLGDGARATLTALSGLGRLHRRLLLLDSLARVPLPVMAREVARDPATVERELAVATEAFASARGVGLPAVRETLQGLAPATAGTPWPLAQDVRRSGAGRRRTHTAAGAIGAVAALLVGGSLTQGQVDPGGGEVRPTLSTEPLTGTAPAPGGAIADGGDEGPAGVAGEPGLEPDDLLDAGGLGALLPGRTWLAGAGDDNTRGDGLVVPCQRERFADPAGADAAVRQFTAAPQPGGAYARAVQLTELSTSQAAARAAYRRSASWYAGCADPGTRLVSTHRLPLTGDDGAAFVLRRSRPGETVVVTLTRSGRYTHTLARLVRDGPTRTDPAAARPVAAVLGLLVDRECGDPPGGSCAGAPLVTDRPPLPAGPAPEMLSEFDLPEVVGVRAPWAGTEPGRARTNPAATGCDRTSFGNLRADRTRTFLVPRGRLPVAFGLTETVGVARGPVAARQLVRRVRRQLGRCSDEEAGTTVRRIADGSGAREDLAAWVVTTEVSDARSLRFLMAVVRRGSAVAQVGFVPAGERTIREADFLALALRARDRLAEAPAPRARRR